MSPFQGSTSYRVHMPPVTLGVIHIQSLTRLSCPASSQLVLVETYIPPSADTSFARPSSGLDNMEVGNWPQAYDTLLLTCSAGTG